MPYKRYLIGIDSDGTVFDSMVIKHRRVFQPVALAIWDLASVASVYCAIAESINLYSVHRGINRFAGLAMAFERLAVQSPEGRKAVEGYVDLQEFVVSSGALSHAALEEYNRSKQSAFLDRVLEWSQRSDVLYSEIMEAEGNPSYPFVHESLERASEQADIFVISSSSRKTLEHDWGNAGLLPLVARIEGQEQGSKTCQLKSALQGRYAPNCALMMGDALGDLEAAQEHDILFYPIKPGAESASWERFATEAIDHFLNGTYAGDYEQGLLSEFGEILKPDAHDLKIETSAT